MNTHVTVDGHKLYSVRLKTPLRIKVPFIAVILYHQVNKQKMAAIDLWNRATNDAFANTIFQTGK